MGIMENQVIKLWLVIFFVSQFALVNVQAENKWFIGGGGGLLNFDDEIDQVDTGNLLVRGGVSLGQYLDIGAELGFTVLTDDINDVDHDLQTLFAFIKAKLPLSDQTSLYVLLGKTNVKLIESIRRSSDKADDDGLGIGIGVQVQSKPNLYYTVDYVSYFDDDEFDTLSSNVRTGAINFGFISYY